MEYTLAKGLARVGGTLRSVGPSQDVLIARLWARRCK